MSSDPLAGSSASTQNASFSGGGTESGGLGIKGAYNLMKEVRNFIKDKIYIDIKIKSALGVQIGSKVSGIPKLGAGISTTISKDI